MTENTPMLYEKTLEPYLFKKGHIQSSNFEDNTHEDVESRIMIDNYYLKKYIIPTFDSPVFIVQDTKNRRLFSVLIIGGSNTPYQDCVFPFQIFLQEKYPMNPPKMNFKFLGDFLQESIHYCILKDGRVVAPLLGNCKHNVNSAKWDIESTIAQLVNKFKEKFKLEDPYFEQQEHDMLRNSQDSTDSDIKSRKYNQKIRMLSMAHGICDVLKNIDSDDYYLKEFKTVIENHFYLKHELIMKTLNRWQKEFDSNVEDSCKTYRSIDYQRWVHSSKLDLESFVKKMNSKK